MKVLLISGSPRAKGNTRQLLDLAAAVIEEAGLETEVISLSGLDIASCRACGSCAKSGRCALNDGLNDIIAKVKAADGLIIGAPVYFGTARGDVMNLLQRLGMVARSNGNWLSGKVGGPIAVARRGGQTATLSEMLMFFFINGMIVPGSTYWNMVFGKVPGEAMQDEEGVGTIKTFAANVAGLIKKLQ